MYWGMIARCMLIVAGLLMAGLVGAFFLYVSALALLTSMAVGIGLIATLALGYWAGSNSSKQPPPGSRAKDTLQVINTRGDVTVLQEIPAMSMKRETGIRIVRAGEHVADLSGATLNR